MKYHLKLNTTTYFLLLLGSHFHNKVDALALQALILKSRRIGWVQGAKMTPHREAWGHSIKSQSVSQNLFLFRKTQDCYDHDHGDGESDVCRQLDS
jgi:hypothetical protein